MTLRAISIYNTDGKADLRSLLAMSAYAALAQHHNQLLNTDQTIPRVEYTWHAAFMSVQLL
jgi:hypothetical protein